MCCNSIAGKVFKKDGFEIFVEARCVGIPVIVAVPTQFIESVTHLHDDFSIIKLSDNFDSNNVKIFDPQMKNHFFVDFALIGSDQISQRIIPWFVAANAFLMEYDGIVQGVSLAFTVAGKLLDWFGPNKTLDEVNKLRREIRENFAKMTALIEQKFSDLETYLENNLFLDMRAELNALIIGLKTVESYIGGTSPAEQQEQKSILDSMNNLDGIRMFSKVHAVTVDRNSKYSVRLGAGLIMIQIVQIINTSHAIAHTSNQAIIEVGVEAIRKLIADLPLEFADDRYQRTWWSQNKRDPETGEMITISHPGFTGPTGTVSCLSNEECDSKLAAIVIPNFKAGKGKSLFEAEDALYKLKGLSTGPST